MKDFVDIRITHSVFFKYVWVREDGYFYTLKVYGHIGQHSQPINLGRGTRGQHIHGSSFLPHVEVKKKIFQRLIHFYYMVTLALPLGLNPWPWEHEFQNIGKGLYWHHNNAFSFPHMCRNREEDFLKFNTYFTTKPYWL